MALAIGANAVVFGILNALLLRRCIWPCEDSLYGIHRKDDKSGNESYLNDLDLRDRNRSFDGISSKRRGAPIFTTTGAWWAVWSA